MITPAPSDVPEKINIFCEMLLHLKIDAYFQDTAVPLECCIQDFWYLYPISSEIALARDIDWAL